MKLRTLALTAAIITAPTSAAFAASTYEWDLSGNTSASIGTGSLTILPGTPTTSFGTTTIGGNTDGYLNVPKMTSNTNQGIDLTFPSSGPNGGSASFINQYTVAFDLNIAAPSGTGWAALEQTSTGNASGNDADFYVTNTGALGGTAAMGSSAAGAFTFNTWNRVVETVDLQAGKEAFYVNGTQVFIASITGVDGRFSLDSNLQAGADLLLFNEGFDTTGGYTEPLKVSAIGFTDTALTATQVAALGGDNGLSIFAVPEPTSIYLGFFAAGAFLIGRRLRRNA